MIFRPVKDKIKRTRDYKKLFIHLSLVLVGIICFIAGFLLATPIMSLFR